MTISISIGLGASPAVAISGTPDIGSTLHLAPVSLEGASPMAYSVAWLRDGTPISGATNASYTIIAADVGQDLSLRLTKPDGTQIESANTIRVAAASTPVVSYVADVTDAARDKIIHDTNAAWGANSATISLSGTSDAPAGTAIMAEVVLDASNSLVGTGMRVATVGSGGTWSGSYTGMVRRPEWLRARVWVDGNPAEKATTTTAFGTGHVIALWGQSEIANIAASPYNGATVPSITTDEMVSVHYADGGPQHELIVEGDTTNTRFAAMANSLMASRPGEKFSIVIQAASGTGFDQLVDDNSEGGLNRWWSNDAGLNESIGSPVGIMAMSWYVNPNYGLDYGDAAHRMIFGKEIDGTPIGTLPVSGVFPQVGNWSTSGLAKKFDHTFTELYDFSENTGTRVAILAPHRVPRPGMFANRRSVRDMYTNSAEPALVYAPDVNGYRNGYLDGSGTFWNDGTHPSAGEIGSEAFAIGLVQSALNAMGLEDWAVPKVDNAYWDASGAYFELWSNAGPIIARDGSSRIVGVTVNGVHVDAQIVNIADGAQANGAIRVTAADVGSGDPFDGNTAVTFMSNANGFESPENNVSQMLEGNDWDNVALVDVGVPGLPGWAVEADPDETVLASTLASNPKFVTTAETLVRDGSGMFDGDTQGLLTVRYIWNLDYVIGSDVFMAFSTGSSNGLLMEVLGTYALRYSYPYGPGNLTTPANTLAQDTYQEVIVSFDPVNGLMKVFVDGTLVVNESRGAWNWLTSSQQLRFLNQSSGDAGVYSEIESITVWKEFTSDGDVSGFAAPYKVIAGDGVADAASNAADAPVFNWFENGSRIN